MEFKSSKNISSTSTNILKAIVLVNLIEQLPETRMASNMEKQQSVQGNTKSDIQTFTPQGSQHGGGDNRGPKVTPRWLFPFLGVPLFSVLPFLHNIGMSPCKGSVPPPRPLSDPQAQLCLSLLGPPCAKSVFKRKLLKG